MTSPCPRRERHLDNCHVTRYNWRVIKTFADKRTQELYLTGQTRRLPPDVARRAARKLEYVHLATRLEDLRVPPGNRLHSLEREREGQHAIAINDQWRICFRFEGGDAYEVEVTDYH
jgi:proteic killer suppression protein